MPVEVIMPKVDMVMEVGTIAHWHKAEGEAVRAGEPLFEIETDKATMEVEAPASGTLAQIRAAIGTTVPVATVIALITAPGEAFQSTSIPTTTLSPASQATAPTESDALPRLRATPLARQLARAHGLDLTTIAGHGAQGRIRKDDVLTTLALRQAAAPTSQNGHVVAAVAQVEAAQQADSAASTRGIAPKQASAGQLVPLSGVRRIVAQRLTASVLIPQFALSIEVDMTRALEIREQLPYRPSVTALIALVVARVLQQHSSFNASFTDQGIWLHTPIHLGIALNSGGDLLVPVIQNAQQCTLREIATRLSDIRQRAEAKKLLPGELQGSTFSISNLGMLGIDQFQALINPPEAAILAVGRSIRRAVEIDGAPMFRPMLQLTLTADHRVNDGAAAASFLQSIRTGLEEPLLLL